MIVRPQLCTSPRMASLLGRRGGAAVPGPLARPSEARLDHVADEPRVELSAIKLARTEDAGG